MLYGFYGTSAVAVHQYKIYFEIIEWIENFKCTSSEATSLDWKISVFGKSQCSATACWWEIEDISSWKRWKNSVGHILGIVRQI
jgi:hypothetical protein